MQLVNVESWECMLLSTDSEKTQITQMSQIYGKKEDLQRKQRKNSHEGIKEEIIVCHRSQKRENFLTEVFISVKCYIKIKLNDSKVAMEYSNMKTAGNVDNSLQLNAGSRSQLKLLFFEGRQEMRKQRAPIVQEV